MDTGNHSWARTPRIWGPGEIYYIKFVRYYNGIRRRGGGGAWFKTQTPCVVPRYAGNGCALYVPKKSSIIKTQRCKVIALQIGVSNAREVCSIVQCEGFLCFCWLKKPRHFFYLRRSRQIREKEALFFFLLGGDYYWPDQVKFFGVCKGKNSKGVCIGKSFVSKGVCRGKNFVSKGVCGGKKCLKRGCVKAKTS